MLKWLTFILLLTVICMSGRVAGAAQQPSEMDAALFDAAAHGNVAQVKTLLDRGANVNAADASGDSLLVTTILSRHRTVAELLIARGAKVDFGTAWGITPLMAAAGDKNLLLVRLLLANKADPGAGTEGGETPLLAAITAGDYAVVQALLIGKADVNRMNFRSAETPLMYAAKSGRADIVALLLAHHADAKAVSEAGQTALTFAQKGTGKGYREAVRLLKKATAR